MRSTDISAADAPRMSARIGSHSRRRSISSTRRAGTQERIAALAAHDLDGVEVRHPSHSSEDAARLLALVEHYSMVPSGGSDWHGAAEGPRTLGTMRVPAEWLSRQDERVRARATT